MNFKELNKVCAVTSVVYALALAACQAPIADEAAPSETLTAEKPSLVMGVVQNAIVEVGEGLVAQEQVQGQGLQGKVVAQVSAVDQLCNEHAMPLDAQGGYLDSQSADYPSRLFYCKLAKNTSSPDSIPGSLRQIKSISCAVEKAGVVFDNQEHQVTVPMDTGCFTQEQLDTMGVGTMTVTLRASKPAFFNTYYDTGISINVPNMGVYRMAAKVSGTTVEFLTHDDQTALSPHKSGTYAASFDLLTGVLRFESRGDRFLCAENSSCGWSRHDRILANVTMSNGEITAVSSIQGIAAEIFDSRNGQYSARISTIKGALSSGLKARYFHTNSNVSADLGLTASYSEVVNNRCYTQASDQADCGLNVGISLPQESSLIFSLHPDTQSVSPAAWVSQLMGLKFNSVTFADIEQ